MRLDRLPRPWNEWLTTATCEYLSAPRVAVVGVSEDMVLACQSPDILSMLLVAVRAEHPEAHHLVVTSNTLLADMHALGARLDTATMATTPLPKRGTP